MNKVYESADAAVADIFDGMTLMAGGFGLSGNPENLISAIHRKGTRDISLISNNCGTTDLGLGDPRLPPTLLVSMNQRQSEADLGLQPADDEARLSGNTDASLGREGSRSDPRCELDLVPAKGATDLHLDSDGAF